MHAYCRYVESSFGYIQMPKRDAFFEHELRTPLRKWIKEWVVQGRISEDDAAFFLKSGSRQTIE